MLPETVLSPRVFRRVLPETVPPETVPPETVPPETVLPPMVLPRIVRPQRRSAAADRTAPTASGWVAGRARTTSWAGR